MATVTSVKSGYWHDSDTWDVGVPQESDDVVVQQGHIVTLNQPMDTILNSISNSGSLYLAGSGYATTVTNSGYLEIELGSDNWINTAFTNAGTLRFSVLYNDSFLHGPIANYANVEGFSYNFYSLLIFDGSYCYHGYSDSLLEVVGGLLLHGNGSVIILDGGAKFVVDSDSSVEINQFGDAMIYADDGSELYIYGLLLSSYGYPEVVSLYLNGKMYIWGTFNNYRGCSVSRVGGHGTIYLMSRSKVLEFSSNFIYGEGVSIVPSIPYQPHDI